MTRHAQHRVKPLGHARGGQRAEVRVRLCSSAIGDVRDPREVHALPGGDVSRTRPHAKDACGFSKGPRPCYNLGEGPFEIASYREPNKD